MIAMVFYNPKTYFIGYPSPFLRSAIENEAKKHRDELLLGLIFCKIGQVRELPIPAIKKERFMTFLLISGRATGRNCSE